VQGPWRTIVTDRHKLSVRGDYDRVESLVDLHDDPLEIHNLAGRPEHSKVQKELLAELGGWATRTNDLFPEKPGMAREAYSDEQAAAARRR
jgi:hypothetical protein